MKYIIIPIITKTTPITVDHKDPFFSKKFTNFCPNFAVKKETKKNLKPLPIKQMIKNINILKPIIPLVIVNTLNGNGVKLAKNKIPSQTSIPPVLDMLFLRLLTFCS